MSRRRSHRRNMATRRPKFTAIDLARKQLPRQSFVSLSGVVPFARSFTPQRHLIGCAPWPAHYTGCQNTFSPSRNPPGTYRESPSALPSPPPRPALSPRCARYPQDKGCACLYLKAADRMKCTMELSPHVASRFERSERRFPRRPGRRV